MRITIEKGRCQCGCGQATRIARRSDPRSGDVKGQPRRFLRGHANTGRRRAVRWVEEDRGYETLCWVWQLAKERHGYGIEGAGGRCRLAHRAVYEAVRGPIPADRELDHLCRVRECVNPGHLEPVTGAVNVRRGLSAKLTETQVVEIRSRLVKGERRADLAREFGVGWSTVQHIAVGDSWKGDLACA